jgi:hypothetical protein
MPSWMPVGIHDQDGHGFGIGDESHARILPGDDAPASSAATHCRTVR